MEKNMRGLDARMLLVRARVAETLHGRDGALAADLAFDAQLEAEAQGYRDAMAGLPDPPPLFAGEPSLLRPWQAGYDRFQEALEMRDCPHCDDGTGDPCPCHG
jgi:hypothetical protein